MRGNCAAALCSFMFSLTLLVLMLRCCHFVHGEDEKCTFNLGRSVVYDGGLWRESQIKCDDTI